MMTQNNSITIISGTNRSGSNTRIFTEALHRLVDQWSEADVNILDLRELQGMDIRNGMFDANQQHPIIKELQDQFIIPASKFIFVVPEYNGSFPGIVKYFIDACSVRHFPENFMNKSAFLIGVSTGRAGNIRGLDHLTGILNYLQTHVHPMRIPVSKVDSIMNIETPEITDPELLGVLEQHLLPFMQEENKVVQAQK